MSGFDKDERGSGPKARMQGAALRHTRAGNALT
jgi:hypothetical protein